MKIYQHFGFNTNIVLRFQKMMQTNFVLHKHVSKEEEVKVLNLHQQVVPNEENWQAEVFAHSLKKSPLKPRTLNHCWKVVPDWRRSVMRNLVLDYYSNLPWCCYLILQQVLNQLILQLHQLLQLYNKPNLHSLFMHN